MIQPNVIVKKGWLRYVLLSSLFIFTLLLLSWFVVVSYGFATFNLPLQKSIHFDLEPGTNLPKLAEQLHQSHALKHPEAFIRYVKWRGLAKRLQAGEYKIEHGMTVAKLVRHLVRGHVVVYQITLVEGWTFQQFQQALLAIPLLEHELSRMPPEEVMLALGFAKQSAEGMFYPDTYQFTKASNDYTIYQRANQTMNTLLAYEWQTRAPELPYHDAYSALIAASLIEKETAIAAERPMVSAVIVNRLRAKMPLQFDPTVIYALDSHYSGHLTRNDLQYPSPYNTYKHKGLPPTPIAMPSKQSIHAALHPLHKPYYYFVATGNGGHVFSETLAAHRKAVKQYRMRQQQAHE